MNADAPERHSEGVEILGKVGAVIDALARAGELSVNDLVAAVDEPVSSTYRLLSNLVQTGMVTNGSRRGRYRLGLFFMRIGSEVEDRIDIRERAIPALRRLLDETGQTVYLCVRDRLRAVCIERLDGGDVRSMALRLGTSLPLTIGGAPTAILAFLPESEYESVRDASLAVDGAEGRHRTAVEVDALTAGIRAAGVAVSDGDVTPGVAAIGAPVFNHRGEVVGAVSVSGIRDHILGDSLRVDVAAATRTCADTVSSALGWRGMVVR